MNDRKLLILGWIVYALFLAAMVGILFGLAYLLETKADSVTVTSKVEQLKVVENTGYQHTQHYNVQPAGRED